MAVGLKKRVRRGKNTIFRFLEVKMDYEARLAAVESELSKKARVGINGGLSKIGGPLIFSVSE